MSIYPLFKLDTLNGFISLGIVFFSLLTVIYSSRFMKGKPHLAQYYGCIFLTALAALGAALANNLILLLVCWGFLGPTLYLLINLGGSGSGAAAKKSLIIVGGSDALMLFGIGIIYCLTGSFQMDKIRISLTPAYYLTAIAYISIAVACFAKAGLAPFHSWVPDCAQSAPLPVAAYVLASLDKLLGIYLLARISLNLFIMNKAMNILLMLMGALTIIAAVMMALVQHNMKRLLGYHAVSQVGYMVLGIGTGNPIGIAGGLFHMLNNAIYKHCLFLASGNVEFRAKSTELDELGGLAKGMPLTYISALVASLSISGVPPFCGFFSKWMIYQGLLQQWQVESYLLKAVSILCLVAAMFGSVLTLASFMKLLHAVFLGQQRNNDSTKQRINEVEWQMWLPCLVLAVICIIFGVFARQIPLHYFILPAIRGVSFIGTWQAGLSTLLIIISLVLGFLLLCLKWARPLVRQDTAFIGGELIDLEETRVTGTEFYNSVKEFWILKDIYKGAERGLFDIYEQAKIIVFGLGKFFQNLHNGVLPTYLAWTLLGMMYLFWAFLR